MGTREIRSRQDVAPLAIVTVVGVTATIAALHGVAHDLGTAGSLSSVLALPIMVAIFYAARLLHHRLRRARMATPRREDRRNRGGLSGSWPGRRPKPGQSLYGPRPEGGA